MYIGYVLSGWSASRRGDARIAQRFIAGRAAPQEMMKSRRDDRKWQRVALSRRVAVWRVARYKQYRDSHGVVGWHPGGCHGQAKRRDALAVGWFLFQGMIKKYGSFSRPSGTGRLNGDRVPSDESLGYYRLPLRGRGTA